MWSTASEPGQIIRISSRSQLQIRTSTWHKLQKYLRFLGLYDALFAGFSQLYAGCQFQILPDNFFTNVFRFFFSRKTKERQLISDVRQHKIIRSSPASQREFVPFVGLILVALAMLVYYLGKTQRFTIQGINRNPALLFFNLFYIVFLWEGWWRKSLIIWKNFAFRKALRSCSKGMLRLE